MLKHVVKRQVLDGVISGVDVRVRVGELGLDDKGRWVASLGGRGVIRASIATLGLDPRDVAVLFKGLELRLHR